MVCGIFNGMCVYFFEKMWKEVKAQDIYHIYTYIWSYDSLYTYIYDIIRYRHIHTLKIVFFKNYKYVWLFDI